MARFTVDELTGEQYDEVELILGCEISSEVTLRKLARAVGYVRGKAANPGLKFDEYNKRTISQHIDDSGLVAGEDDTAGKDAKR